MLEERIHIDDQIFDHGSPRIGSTWILTACRSLLLETGNEGLAGQGIGAVDAHRVRAADAVGAGAAQGQRAILLPT